MKKDILQLLAFLLIGTALSCMCYYWLQCVFAAGIISGFTAAIILLATVGKIQARRVGKNIEKRMRDYIATN